MLLVADVGNTDTVFGAWDREALKHVWRVDSRTARTADEWAVLVRGLLEPAGWGLVDVEELVIGSVIPDVTRALTWMSERNLGKPALVVTSTSALGIAVEVDDPAQAGVDRVVDCLAAWARNPVASCVIDFGTATTFNYLKATGAFGGGMIAPGIKTSLEALASRGAQLKNVAIEAPPRAIGTNTQHAMQSAIVFGYAAMVEGLIARMESEAGAKLRVVATGGLAKTIAPHCRMDEVVETLTLEGYRLAWKKLRGR